MNDPRMGTELYLWMDRLNEYLEYLSSYNNPSNNYYINNLAILLEGVADRLNLEEIKSNYLVQHLLCCISKERIERAVRLAGGSFEQLKQTGCLDKLTEKLDLFIEESTMDLEFELDKQDTYLSGKILYLAITGKLNKDTYELTKRNALAYGNYGVMIDTFLRLDKEIPLDPANPYPHYESIINYLIEMNNGSLKLKNDQAFALNISVFNYLTSKGYNSINAAQLIASVIRKTYNKYNPYVDQHKVQIDESTVVEFSRRSRFDRNLFFSFIEHYKVYIQTLPIELKSILKGINIEDERNPDDIYWRQVYTKTHDSGATCNYVTGEINVYQFENNPTEFFNQNVSSYSMYHQLYHELGHAYDYHYTKEWGVETDLISSSPLWLEAMKEDKELSGRSSVTPYGENSPREDFADSIYFYNLNPNYLDNYPNRKRILDEKFKIKKYHPELSSSNIQLD